MSESVKVKQTFRFYTRLHLLELTGSKASSLEQLLELIKEVNGSSIYHHTHHFLQQHQFLSPEPPNDFAYWVTVVLGERKLGEKLASIDIIQYAAIRELRERIVKIIQDYLSNNPSAKQKFVDNEDAFHFIKSVSFVLPTHFEAKDLTEFIGILDKITVDSIYFHIFEARLRLEKGKNDFSNWIETSVGEKELADDISKLDPYTYSMEDLRKKIIMMVKRKL